MSLINKILYEDLPELLTDFKNNQIIFHKIFEQAFKRGCPIQNVLELGVYSTLGNEPANPLHGQSTKTLLALCAVYHANLMISLDIVNCQKTIDFCKEWLQERGINFDNHVFIQKSSLEFEPNCNFDFIFLDTNHDDNYPERIGFPSDTGGAGHTYKEIIKYTDQLSENGRMLIHDTKNFYVQRTYGLNTEGAIRRFMDEKGTEFEFYEYNTNKHGLGEIKRKL